MIENVTFGAGGSGISPPSPGSRRASAAGNSGPRHSFSCGVWACHDSDVSKYPDQLSQDSPHGRGLQRAGSQHRGRNATVDPARLGRVRDDGLLCHAQYQRGSNLRHKSDSARKSTGDDSQGRESCWICRFQKVPINTRERRTTRSSSALFRGWSLPRLCAATVPDR